MLNFPICPALGRFVAAFSCEQRGNEHAKKMGAGMIGEEAGTARGAGATDPSFARYATELNEILRRVASIIGDIDVLKRERLSEESFEARARLASAYFQKRWDPVPLRRKAA